MTAVATVRRSRVTRVLALLTVFAAVLVAALAAPTGALAGTADSAPTIADLTEAATAVAADQGGEESQEVAPLITLAIYLGLLSLLPFAVMTLTSFLRIVIVLGFLRSGLGAQSIPPNVVIIGLSLFLSLFVMGPTIDAIMEEAVPAAQAGDTELAGEIATNALGSFMAKQIGSNSRGEFETFYNLAHPDEADRDLDAAFAEIDACGDPESAPETQSGSCEFEAVGFRELIPTFMVSELKKAFIMGFAVLLPFLVIDMVIANILLSLGMFMLPPVVVSLPFKVLLFVLAGGWGLVVEFLITGFVG